MNPQKYRYWYGDWPMLTVGLMGSRWGLGFRLRRPPECWTPHIYLGPWVFGWAWDRTRSDEGQKRGQC